MKWRWWKRRKLIRLPAWLFRRMLPRRIRRMVLIPILIVIDGTLGYPLIEGEKWTWFDGLYMTVITLTTLGYGEIPEPLSKPGRAFTMLLALCGIFTLFYFATEIVRTVVTGELQELLGREQMEDDLKTLSGHLIVCGFGRMGNIVCDELERQKRRFVVVDKLAPPADWAYKNGLRIHGDATDDEILRKAGIEKAKAVITVVGSDADNLYITLSARLLNSKITIVARAEEEEAEGKLRKVGANKVISPYLAGGHRAVQAVLRPSVLHFMEMATRPEFMDLQIEELQLEAGSQLAGKSLRDSRLSQDYGVIVVAILRPNGDVTYGPPGEIVVAAGDTLVAIGQRKQLDRVEALAKTN
jgi:voltage-gated potassium channel